MDVIELLDRCIAEMASGSTVAECLARHPAAKDLAPMLEAATVAGHLGNARLTEPQRLQAKFALREAIASRAERKRPRWSIVGTRTRSFGLAGMLAALLMITVSLTAVAFSAPGDLAYPVRVAVERVPLLLQTTDQGKTDAELALSERRLVELRGYVSTEGGPDHAALNAVVAGDVSAAQRAEALSEVERIATAARVEEHAQELLQLAASATSQEATEALQTAAEHVLAAAIRLRNMAPAEQIRTEGSPTATVQQLPTPTPTSTSTLRADLTSGHASVTPSQTPVRARTRAAIQATPTAQGALVTRTPGWRATTRSETATADASSTPVSSGTTPQSTAIASSTTGARPRASAIAATATAHLATATARIATATARHATATARAATHTPSHSTPVHTPGWSATAGATGGAPWSTESPPPTNQPSTPTAPPSDTREPTSTPHVPVASATPRGPDPTAGPRPTDQEPAATQVIVAPTSTQQPGNQPTPMEEAPGATRTPEGHAAPPTRAPDPSPAATIAPTDQPGPGPAPSRTPGHS